MPKRIVSSGNFKNGMVPDIIGARDSVVDLVDGFIDRIGLIRKRGRKRIPVDIQTVFPTYPTASINDYYPSSIGTSHSAVGGSDIIASTVVNQVTAKAYWNVAINRSGNTFYVNSGASDYGGGYGMAKWIDVLVSPKMQIAKTNGSNPWQVGLYGGGRNTSSMALGNIKMMPTSSILTNGTNLNTNLTVGDWISITGTSEYFRVMKIISSSSIEVDRIPDPAADPILGRTEPFTRHGCFRPLQAITGVIDYAGSKYPSASTWSPRTAYVACEHQSRMFLANFDKWPSGIGWSATYSESPSRNGLFAIGSPTIMPIDVYFDDAFAQIGSSDGGEIMGMHSLNNQLVILKTDSIHVLRGEVSTIGLPTGASIDVVVPDSGCPHFESHAVSRIGVVWANSDGLWTFNGSSLRNISDGVVDSIWSIVGNTPVVSALNDRIVVQNSTTGDTIVYHIDDQYFYRQDTSPQTNLVEFRVNNYSLLVPEGNVNQSVFIGISRVPKPHLTIANTSVFYPLDWLFDYILPSYNDGNVVPPETFFLPDNFGLDEPLLKILTQPIDPGYPFTDNRMNQVLVSGYITSRQNQYQPPYPLIPPPMSPGPALPALMKISLISGREAVSSNLEPVQELEYGFIPTGDDTSQRIPIDGNRSTPATRIYLEEVDDVDHDTALDISIYGIAAEFLEDNTVGNDA